MKEFISLTMVAMETEKSSFSVIIATCENFFKNLNLIDSNHHYKYLVDWLTVGWDKMSQPQKCKFLEKRKKVKNIKFGIS